MDLKNATHEPCSSVFDQWLIRKGRLERGQKVLSTLQENYFNTEEADEEGVSAKSKQELLQELIICSVAIDCSLDSFQNKTGTTTQKDSMKVSLRKWLIQQRFAFEDILIRKEIYDKFSENGKEFMFMKNSCGSMKMLSCSYSKTQDMSSDQRLQNSLFLTEYNREWDLGTKKLIKKCIEEMLDKGIAEAKTTQEMTPSFIQEENENENDAKESKSHYLWRSETKERATDNRKSCRGMSIKEDANQALEIRRRKVINAGTFGVSPQIFQNFLSFGIHRLIRIEKDYKNRQIVKDREQKAQQKLEAKRAHDQWKERKTIRKKDEKVNDGNDKDEIDVRMENYPHLFQSSRLLSKKTKFTALPKSAAPRIWMKRNPGKDCNRVVIHWDSHNELNGSDFFIISLGNESDNSASKVWRDPPEPGRAHSLAKEIDLSPLSTYWISVRIYTSNRASPEARIVIPSTPCPPSAPILLKASESSMKISWIPAGHFNYQTQKNESYIVELCIDDEKDEWIRVWKGHNNIATLNGLTPDTAYKVRIYCRNTEGFCSSPGDTSIFYTRLKIHQPPRLLNKDRSVGRGFVELCWDRAMPEINTDDLGSSLSISKCFYSIDTSHKDWIHEDNFNDLLAALGVIVESEENIKIAKRTLSIDQEGKISFYDFHHWWKTHLTYTIHQRQKEDKYDDSRVVYKGTDQAVKVKHLLENTCYEFTISSTTLRGSSTESKGLCVHTLPGSARQIINIQVDFNNILLKILYNSRCKIKVEKLEETTKTNIVIHNKQQRERLNWSKVYEGNSEIIKVTSLRSDREYRFRCQCVNLEGGTSNFIFSETIRTATTKFQLNTRTINNSFIIDCTNAITHGDLILFSEIDNHHPAINTNKNKQRNTFHKSYNEKCIIARVILIKTSKTRPEGRVNMEVAWVSSSSGHNSKKSAATLKVGTMIERNLMSMKTCEILRMPWVDENNRT